MTIATDTTPAEATPVEATECPKCGAMTLQKVPDVDVRHCDGCGYAEGTVKPDEVIAAASTEVEHRASASDAAVERIADAAESVDLPGTNEFKALCVMARTLAFSQIIPRALQGKPADVLVVLLTARDLGIPSTTALSQIHVIDGKPTLSPKLLSARVQRMGMGRIVQAYKSENLVIAAAVEPGRTNIDQRCITLSVAAIANGDGTRHWLSDDGSTLCRCHGVIGFSSFTWTEAQQPTDKNRLVDTRCEPNKHVVSCHCKTNWRNYGASRMLWQRVRGYCADDWFPEASLGLYSAEELGAVTDDEGEPIDVSTVEVPEGFAPAALPPDASQDPADPAEIAAFRARIAALPENERAWLHEQWGVKMREGRLAPLDDLTARGAKIAGPLIAGAENKAKAHGWSPPEQPTDALAEASQPETAAQSVSEPPEAAESTDPPAADDEGETAQPGLAEGVLTQELAEQFGQAAPVMTDALITQAIDAVQVMTAKALNAALRKRALSWLR